MGAVNRVFTQYISCRASYFFKFGLKSLSYDLVEKHPAENAESLLDNIHYYTTAL